MVVCVPLALIAIPAGIVVEVVLSPISIPLYFYRARKYEKWIDEWRRTLSDGKRQRVEKYINGPITLASLHKFSDRSINITINKSPAKSLVPACLLQPIHLLCNTQPSKASFIYSLEYMVLQLILPNDPSKKYALMISRKVPDVVRMHAFGESEEEMMGVNYPDFK